jgi:hypothetical protein
MDQTDRHLFFSSTWVQIGNGKTTPFWEARWLLGSAPKDLAPHLFECARYKGRTIATEFKNNNWIKNLQDISSTTHLEEFTLLFMALSDVQLNDQKDQIY